jgi:hypothetical protein
LSKLKTSLENKNYYEAHQMYRTLYFRYSGQGKYDLLEQMLYDGAITFFGQDQVTSAIDLAKLYVETLTAGNTTPTEVHFERVVKLYLLMPGDNVDKPPYLASSLKWSSRGGGAGHPRLHQHLAYGLWQEKEYQQSTQHFLHGGDGEGCGQMLVEYHSQKGLKSEADMFIARAVLQYLCMKKHIAAALAFHSYTSNHPKIRPGPPYTHPLLNFLWLLLLSIQNSLSVSMYTVLCEKYHSQLDRDPTYLEYLDKIGQTFFGVPPPAKASSSMFSGLFDQIVTAMNEDEESSEEEGGPQPGTSRTVEAHDMETADLD